MPDACRCLICGHKWFPRYRKSNDLRKCPNCRKKGQYEVLSWYQQTNPKYFGKGRPAGSERVGCGCFLLISISLFLIGTIFLFFISSFFNF